MFATVNLKNPFGKYFKQTFQSNYFNQNDNKLNLSTQRCHYPGPGNWNGPYILNYKKNCIFNYINKFSKISEKVIFSIDNYKNLRNVDSLIFELNQSNNNFNEFPKNIHSYKLFAKFINFLSAKEELLFTGRIYPTKSIYQNKIDEGFKPDYIYIKLFDEAGNELNFNDLIVRLGLIYKVSFPRVKYSSKEFYRLQDRIKEKYPKLNDLNK